MKKTYSTTWKENVDFTFDNGVEFEFECDIYPLIVEQFATYYDISERAANNILSQEEIYESFYYDFEDEIYSLIQTRYINDAWDAYCNTENIQELIQDDLLQRL